MQEIANALYNVSENFSLKVERQELVTHRDGSVDDEQPSPACNAIASIQVVKDSSGDLRT
jgi:hypothetical protein